VRGDRVPAAPSVAAAQPAALPGPEDQGQMIGSTMRPAMSRRFLCVLALSLALASRAAADEIQLRHGDRLTGKIVSAEGGKVVIKTEQPGTSPSISRR
jgi:hypothetical protein